MMLALINLLYYNDHPTRTVLRNLLQLFRLTVQAVRRVDMPAVVLPQMSVEGAGTLLGE
jgi:hypothetical protein